MNTDLDLKARSDCKLTSLGSRIGGPGFLHELVWHHVADVVLVSACIFTCRAMTGQHAS